MQPVVAPEGGACFTGTFWMFTFAKMLIQAAVWNKREKERRNQARFNGASVSAMEPQTVP